MHRPHSTGPNWSAVTACALSASVASSCHRSEPSAPGASAGPACRQRRTSPLLDAEARTRPCCRGAHCTWQSARGRVSG